MRRTLIVGAGYAGLLAAQRLARKSRGKMEVVLVNPRPYLVERVRLHQDAAGDSRTRVPLLRRLAGSGVTFREGSVLAVDFSARRAAIDGASGTTNEAFDDLILATGSIATGGPPGAARFAHTIALESDTFALRAALEGSPTARVVICGGGFTGVELATELAERRRGLRITLVTGGQIVPTVGEQARSYIRGALDRLGVERLEKTRVDAIERDGVVVEGGSIVPADVTVWAGGFRASPLVAKLGLAVGPGGRALVDDRLRSLSQPFVHVAGDAAFTPLRMACATALPMGAFVADDIVRDLHGRDAEPFSFGFAGVCVSLGRRDAVVQGTDRLDRPTWIGFRGRSGAYLKELIIRFAMNSSTFERRGLAVPWLKGPALFGASERPLLRAS
ncbi:MAG TPA: FAD-dependent oxidoreductase [Polyangia bacterium]